MPIYYAEPQIAIPDSKLLHQNVKILRWTAKHILTQIAIPDSKLLHQNANLLRWTRTAIPDSTLLCWIVQTILPHEQRFPIPNSYTELPNYIVTQIAIPDSKLLHWTAKLCCCANSDSWMLETLILDSKLLTVILGKVHSLFFTLTYGISLLLEMSQLYLNHGNLSCWIERIDWVDRKILYLRMFMSPRNP